MKKFAVQENTRQGSAGGEKVTWWNSTKKNDQQRNRQLKTRAPLFFEQTPNGELARRTKELLQTEARANPKLQDKSGGAHWN